MKSLAVKYIKNYSGLSGLCWRGIAINFANSSLAGLFHFLSIYFVSSLHMNIPTASSIISCYGLGAIVGGYISGKLSDKISPLKVSIISILIESIGYFLLFGVENKFILAANMLILGIAAYGFITSNHLWILSLCKENESQKLKAINLLSTSSNLGLGLSGILIGSIYRYGFKNIFLLTSFLLLVLSFYLMSQIKITKKFSNCGVLKTSETTFKKSSNDKLIWLILLSVLFVGSIVAQRSSTYSVYIENVFPQMGIAGVSILFSLNSFMVVLLATPIGNIFINKNKVLMLGVGGFFIGIGMALLNLTMFFFFAILSCIIYTIGEIIFFCMAQYICYQNGAENEKGRSLGAFRMTYAASRVLGPIGGGYLYHVASGHMIWWLSGAIGILCLLGCNKYKNLS